MWLSNPQYRLTDREIPDYFTYLRIGIQPLPQRNPLWLVVSHAAEEQRRLTHRKIVEVLYIRFQRPCFLVRDKWKHIFDDFLHPAAVGSGKCPQTIARPT